MQQENKVSFIFSSALVCKLHACKVHFNHLIHKVVSNQNMEINTNEIFESVLCT